MAARPGRCEIPRPAGENAGLRDDAGSKAADNKAAGGQNLVAAPPTAGVILSAAVLQAERRISCGTDPTRKPRQFEIHRPANGAATNPEKETAP